MQPQPPQKPDPPLPPSPTGLSQAEAAELARRGLHNQIPRSREGGFFNILRKNALTLFNLLNILLAALLFWVGSYRNMLFLGVVVSNTLIGLVQELRAKRMHDRLQFLSEGTVRAIRDGQELRLPPGLLVLGDLVRLGRGDQVPADAQVAEGACEANESLLTGESDPLPKQAGDTLLSGSYLTQGTVLARLTAVGAESYAGKLQMSARKVKRPRSLLMEDMQVIIRRVSIAIVPMGLLLFGKQTLVMGLSRSVAITRTVAAVLGMIPEGLVLLTSVALAVGVVRLGRKKALVNELYGIESLARTNIICMDKTGTLTSGAMALTETVPLSGLSGEQLGACVRALISATPETSPTQNALREAFGPGDAPHAQSVIPFASERQWSAAAFADPLLQTLVLGAPERLLAAFPPALQQARALAAQGLRVLALMQSASPLSEKNLPQGLSPLALFCLKDQLRPQVRETLRYFEEQGVTLKVLSGDSPLTVGAVARDAGLPNADRIIDMSACARPIDYDALAETYTIFGRVSPEDKKQLVKALKRKGNGVAMIGDGVNDIPALKAADCSIAMAGGSDAACRASQITLLDENFAVMPEIVLEGRRVINNITRASSLFLVKNIFSFLLTAALLALPFAYPFAPIQLTLISTLTIGIPSFVLAFQQSRERIRGQFLRDVFLRALPGGVCVFLLVLALCALQALLALSDSLLSSLCAAVAAYTGLWVLLLVCRPLNLLRGLLVAAMAALLTLAMVFFPHIFDMARVTASSLHLLLAGLVLAPLCLWGLTRVTGAVAGTGDGQGSALASRQGHAPGPFL